MKTEILKSLFSQTTQVPVQLTWRFYLGSGGISKYLFPNGSLPTIFPAGGNIRLGEIESKNRLTNFAYGPGLFAILISIQCVTKFVVLTNLRT